MRSIIKFNLSVIAMVLAMSYVPNDCLAKEGLNYQEIRNRQERSKKAASGLSTFSTPFDSDDDKARKSFNAFYYKWVCNEIEQSTELSIYLESNIRDVSRTNSISRPYEATIWVNYNAVALLSYSGRYELTEEWKFYYDKETGRWKELSHYKIR